MTNRTDDFNRADGAIGTPSDGGSAWVQQAGTWTIASNQAAETSGSTSRSAVLETSVTDHDVQATMVIQTVAGQGVISRASDVSNFILGDAIGGTGWQMLKRVAASYTQLGSTATGTPANGDVLKQSASGNNHTTYVNGTSVVTATDSFNNTATLAGLFNSTDINARLDNFTATGTAAASMPEDTLHRPSMMAILAQ